MSNTVSDFLLQRLAAWGIKRIYGFPGDGINGILGALNRAGDEFEFIQVRHEEMAAFMACGHAKFTGEVGVCLATSGPGAIHLLNGLYDAKLDHQPVVAIVGQSARAALGGSYQQEVDLTSLFKDVASEYVEMIVAPEQVRHVIDRALRIARAQRAPTCIIIPNDVQELQAEAPPRMHNTIHSGIGYAIARPIPHEHELQRAADALNAGRKVAMLVGAGALNATAEVLDVADVLGSGFEFDGNAPYAIEVWIHTSLNTVYQQVFGRETRDTQNPIDGYELAVAPTGVQIERVIATSNNKTPAVTFATDRYFHVVAQYTGTTQQVWIDGVQVGQSIDARMTLANGAPALAGASTMGNFFTGDMDELAIYGRPLGADEIQLHHMLGTN